MSSREPKRREKRSVRPQYLVEPQWTEGFFEKSRAAQSGSLTSGRSIGLFQHLVNAVEPVQNMAQRISLPFFGCCATVHWVSAFYRK